MKSSRSELRTLAALERLSAIPTAECGSSLYLAWIANPSPLIICRRGARAGGGTRGLTLARYAIDEMSTPALRGCATESAGAAGPGSPRPGSDTRELAQLALQAAATPDLTAFSPHGLLTTVKRARCFAGDLVTHRRSIPCVSWTLRMYSRAGLVPVVHLGQVTGVRARPLVSGGLAGCRFSAGRRACPI